MTVFKKGTIILLTIDPDPVPDAPPPSPPRTRPLVAPLQQRAAGGRKGARFR